MNETRKIDALTMGNTLCNYVVTVGSEEIEFTSTAFMLWAGLHDFLNTFYFGWTKCSYSSRFTGIGTVYNR